MEIVIGALINAILISGLVVVMMMLIESMNIDTRGDFFGGLRHSKVGQVVISAFLGVIPGCMGGFASVSLYSHGIISFGALVAMMIASSGDEAFAILAMMPDKALWIFLLLFTIAVAVGIIVDLLYHPKTELLKCAAEFKVHEEDRQPKDGKTARHFTWKRALMFAGVTVFIAALLLGWLGGDEPEFESSINILSEEWMYWLFAALSLIVLLVLVLGSDHFVEEHFWHHIVCKHLPSIFGWTFGVLLLLGFALEYLDIASWINSNTALMILLATLVGVIPESGPHLVFVTLYASGIVPLPVLLASCISQDGHASLPLIAESKTSFFKAKTVNCIVALIVGFAAMTVSL